MNNKQRLNLSIKNNLGYRVNPNLILGDYRGFSSGDILDANAVIELIRNVGSVSQLLKRVERLETILDHILSGASEDLDEFREVAEQLKNKADDANTLEGYGIEDAYTKPEIDDLIQNLGDLDNNATDQDINNLFTD